MTLCEKCIHREVCNIRGCHDENDERALTYCADFKNKADFVEVVRCKDCEYYSSVTKYSGEPMHYGYCCNTHDSVLGNRHRYEGDFCSYGEGKIHNG